MKLKIKTNLIFILTGLALTVGAIAVLYYNTSFNLHVEVASRVDAIANEKTEHLRTYFEQTKGRIVDFSSDGKIKDCLAALNGDETVSCTREQLTEHLTTNKLPAIATLREVTALDTSGVVVASTLADQIGSNLAGKGIFFMSKEGAYIENVGFSEPLNTVVFYVSAPVYRNDDFVGVVAGAFSLDELDLIMKNSSDIDESRMTFVVNENGYLVTQTRYSDDVLLTTRVNTQNRQECVNDYREYLSDTTVTEHQENVLVYADHHGVSVIGSHDYFEELNWCVLTEIPEIDALRPVTSSLTFFSIVGFMVMIIVFFVANGLSNLVTKPIVKLKEGLSIIEEGHLDHSVASDQKNEFGELSNSIDRILKTLRSFKEEGTRNKDSDDA